MTRVKSGLSELVSVRVLSFNIDSIDCTELQNRQVYQGHLVNIQLVAEGLSASICTFLKGFVLL